MSEKFIRVYKKIDINDIKKHLLIYGDLSGSCSNCNAMDFKLDLTHCPECQTEFKYVSFRNIKNHIPKVHKLFESKPQLLIVDYEDYTRNLGAVKAQEFLK